MRLLRAVEGLQDGQVAAYLSFPPNAHVRSVSALLAEVLLCFEEGPLPPPVGHLVDSILDAPSRPVEPPLPDFWAELVSRYLEWLSTRPEPF